MQLINSFLFLPYEKKNLFRNQRNLFESALVVLFMLKEKTGKAYSEEIFYVLEQYKATFLKKDMELTKLFEAHKVPMKLQNAYIKALATLNGIKNEAGTGKLFQDKLDTAKAALNSVMEEISQEFPDFKFLGSESSIPSIADIQQELRPNQVILDYFLCKDKLYCLCISKTAKFSFKKEITPDLLEMLSEFPKVIAGRKDLDHFQEPAHELYLLLLKDAEPFIDSVECPKGKVPMLIIMPDEALYGIPFDTLITEYKSVNWFRELSYSILKYNSVYHFSATYWREKRHLKPSNRMSENSSLLFLGERFAKRPSIVLNDLELSVIYDAYKKIVLPKVDSSIELKGANATRSALLKALSKSKYIFIFSHSYLNAQGRLQICAQDKDIDINEIASHKINAELVVLCSCSNGQGEYIPGEGLNGAQRVFMLAGAYNVVYTLFNCKEDDSKRKFLKALEGYNLPDYAGKLREVKLMMLTNERGGFMPYNWCGYQIMGLY